MGQDSCLDLPDLRLIVKYTELDSTDTHLIVYEFETTNETELVDFCVGVEDFHLIVFRHQLILADLGVDLFITQMTLDEDLVI